MRGPNNPYNSRNILTGTVAVSLAAVAIMLAGKTKTDTCIDHPAAVATLEAKSPKQALDLRIEAFASIGTCRMQRAAISKDAQKIGATFDEAPTTNPGAIRKFTWRFNAEKDNSFLPAEAGYHMDIIGKSSTGAYPIDPKTIKAFSMGYRSADGDNYYETAFSRSGKRGDQWTIAVSSNAGTYVYSTAPTDEPFHAQGIPTATQAEQLHEETFVQLAANVQSLVVSFEDGKNFAGLPISSNIR